MGGGRDPTGQEFQGLWIGLLAYRWIALAWMATLAATAGTFRSPALAWALILGTIAWNVWWSLSRAWRVPVARWLDLALSIALLLVSGIVQSEGAIVGDHPFFATAYPITAAMTIGAADGFIRGLVAGAALSVALALSRTLNGVPLDELTAGQLAGLTNGVVYYLSAGGAIGFIAQALRRSAAEVDRAEAEAARERERAARLAEREAIGRQIHDTVLQSLALVNKRGKELGARPSVPGEEVRRLAGMAAEQEQALRGLIARAPEEVPPGCVPLRTVLQAAAFGVSELPVTITIVDPAWLPASWAEDLSAAVRQALENVVRHAHATQAAVFGEREDGEVVVSVRDDGVGFDADEERLRRAGRIGILKSMKGRVEGRGGSVRITSSPGMGTEVEFRVPSGEPE
jgi:signal transduction histidine kinase